VPTVHLAKTDRAASRRMPLTGAPDGDDQQSTIVTRSAHRSRRRFRRAARSLAGRRRPAQARLIAPGQDILASVAPPGNTGSTSTCTAARRCRARTSPASRRCSRTCIRPGRR
jgi:hypothetical protein